MWIASGTVKIEDEKASSPGALDRGPSIHTSSGGHHALPPAERGLRPSTRRRKGRQPGGRHDTRLLARCHVHIVNTALQFALVRGRVREGRCGARRAPRGDWSAGRRPRRPRRASGQRAHQGDPACGSCERTQASRQHVTRRATSRSASGHDPGRPVARERAVSPLHRDDVRVERGLGQAQMTVSL